MSPSQAKKSQPFMPLFFGDFLAATPFWRGEEQGLYLLLLAYQWTSGPLPLEPDRIAAAARYEPSRFLALWQTVRQKFVPTSTGLVNLKLEEHRQRSLDISTGYSEAGKKGAAKRWQGHSPATSPAINKESGHATGEAIDEANSSATDRPMAEKCYPSHPIPSHPNPSQTDTLSASAPPENAADPHARAKPTPDPEPECGGDSRETGKEPEPDPALIPLPDEDDPDFLTLKLTYPDSDRGAPSWPSVARDIASAMKRGLTWPILLKAAEGYRDLCKAKGNLGGRYVTSLNTFLTEDHWKRPWGDAAKAERLKREEAAVLDKLKARRADIRDLHDFRDPEKGESSDAYRTAQDAAWKAAQAARAQPRVFTPPVLPNTPAPKQEHSQPGVPSLKELMAGAGVKAKA